MRTIETVILAWDDQDTSNPGWFTRAIYDDGHQVDEPCESTDESDAPLHEMEAAVVAAGGAWARPSYHDGDGGHFEWRAE